MLDAFSVTSLLFGLALAATAVQLFRHRDQDPSVSDNALVAVAQRVLPVSDALRRRPPDHPPCRAPGAHPAVSRAASRSRAPTCCLRWTRSPRCSGSPRTPTSCSPPTRSPCSACARCSSSCPGCWTGSSISRPGLAVVLGFIGLKLVLHFAHLQSHAVPEISTGLSLAVIAAVLTVTGVASAIAARRDPRARAHAGSLRGGEDSPPVGTSIAGLDFAARDAPPSTHRATGWPCASRTTGWGSSIEVSRRGAAGRAAARLSRTRGGCGATRCPRSPRRGFR